MPRTDKATAILTGMIIAALYVILLASFAQESYLWRESYARRDAANRTNDASHWPATRDFSKQVCSADVPLCAALFADASERQSCVTSIDAIRRYLSAPERPLTLERLHRAMGEQP